MSEKKSTPAVYYSYLYPNIAKACRSCGYACALHGSMARDFDIIAVPWTEEASSQDELLDAVCTAIYGTAKSDYPFEAPSDKPHGRRAWTLALHHGGWVDFSVMPRKTDS